MSSTTDYSRSQAKLTAVLIYRVVPGKFMAADVVKISSAKTVQGQEVKVKAGDGGVMINDAKVIKTDIQTSNGVIHIIDTVIRGRLSLCG